MFNLISIQDTSDGMSIHSSSSDRYETILEFVINDIKTDMKHNLGAFQESYTQDEDEYKSQANLMISALINKEDFYYENENIDESIEITWNEDRTLFKINFYTCCREENYFYRLDFCDSELLRKQLY